MVNAVLPPGIPTRQKLLKSDNLASEGRQRRASAAQDGDYVYHPSFFLPATERTLWGPLRARIPVSHYRLHPVLDSDAPCIRTKRTTLSVEDEKTLFLRYNFAKYRLHRLRARNQFLSSLERNRRIATWEKRAQEIRIKIVHVNLALVPAMARGRKGLGVEFEELLSEGQMALLRGIEKFDVSRGYKFSTYACRCILSSFHRATAIARRRRKHFPVEFDPELERADLSTRKHEEQRLEAIELVRELLLHNHADLSEVERTVILERYPVGSGGQRRTFAEVGKVIGMSNERVRQIETESLRKMRTALKRRCFA